MTENENLKSRNLLKGPSNYIPWRRRIETMAVLENLKNGSGWIKEKEKESIKYILKNSKL